MLSRVTEHLFFMLNWSNLPNLCGEKRKSTKVQNNVLENKKKTLLLADGFFWTIMMKR